jgi:branched-subunit amino acid transport protein
MSLFWGIVLAGLGAYAMRASFVVLLSGVTFPDRVIRILDHVGPAVMAALVRDNTYRSRRATRGRSR